VIELITDNTHGHGVRNAVRTAAAAAGKRNTLVRIRIVRPIVHLNLDAAAGELRPIRKRRRISLHPIYDIRTAIVLPAMSSGIAGSLPRDRRQSVIGPGNFAE